MSKISGYLGYGAFGVALLATLVSLAMSELFSLPPCSLCWYQRIFMYPLVFIIGIGILRRDINWPLTALVVAGVGWVIALYHTLLQWGILPSKLAACGTGGVSCVEQQLSVFGFIDIPLMSLAAFTVIIIMTALYWKGIKNDQRI